MLERDLDISKHASNPVALEALDQLKQVINQNILNPDTNSLLLSNKIDTDPKTDLTLPGYNYLGPGTPVISNILQGKQPVNDYDASALVHDIEYLKGDTYYADYNMWLNNSQSPFKAIFTDRVLNLKNIIPGLNKLLAKPDAEAYHAAKEHAITTNLINRNMFLDEKPTEIREPSFFYKVMHPLSTIFDRK